jgi:hypothetical protein
MGDKENDKIENALYNESKRKELSESSSDKDDRFGIGAQGGFGLSREE